MKNKFKPYKFESNFDVSIVLPFYKKLSIFQITLRTNWRLFQRNGIEVIIVMDEPTEQASLLTLIKMYPLINWKVIVNEQMHDWRNPSKAINVGIKASSKTYVLVLGPDSEMATDVLLEMRRMSCYYENSFFVGRVAFVEKEYVYRYDDIHNLNWLYYGSLFTRKDFLIAVNGYDEAYDRWGGDDDNIRARLQRVGLRKLKLPNCLLLHREDNLELFRVRKVEKETFINRTFGELKQSFNPPEAAANTGIIWGQAFNKVIYDWTDNVFRKELCQKYVLENEFALSQIKPEACNRVYKVIALVATYNEQHNINSLLDQLDRYCDGSILLDDASEDSTFEAAQSNGLIMKVKKKHRNGFDDLSNRNTLLDLASFFKSDFFFFIDADERFDERYCNLKSVVDSLESDTYCFHLIHLWDHPDYFRTNIPEISQINQAGIVQRWRMFRNIGRMQITGDRLHFEATPYKSKKHFAPILLKHYGLINKSVRELKFKRYLTEDEKLYQNPKKYNYFLDEAVIRKPIRDITFQVNRDSY